MAEKLTKIIKTAKRGHTLVGGSIRLAPEK